MTTDYEWVLDEGYSTYKFVPLLQAVAGIREPLDVGQMLAFALSAAMDNEHSLIRCLAEEDIESMQRMERWLLEAEAARAIRKLAAAVQVLKEKEKAATREDDGLNLNNSKP